ncbi:cell wall protein PRY3-like [Gigantopelta aegis]|uniref:cell wall protein PRY3-like n=1 Tax=Gigantopelta aegis TaxID=1735272 RepID=UPI001B88E2D1|nr:cell wall protein PRY3-like [Gigantopelta aegis]
MYSKTLLPSCVWLLACLVCLAVLPSCTGEEDLETWNVLSRNERQACAYEHFSSDHSMCGTVTGTEIPLSQADKDNIVSNHNRIRNEVQPPASNMQIMVWDDELALIALTYAKQCKHGHDSTVNRQALGLPGSKVGQNIHFSSNTFDPVDGVVSWENEKADFTYNTANYRTGHYSEMILHRNAKVGCGVADCSVPGIENRPGLNYIMICNYGAIQTNGEPNRPYCSSSISSSCETCGDTDSKYKNLCACGGKSCFNGGTLDIATCQCTCPKNFGHTIVTGSLCETLTCGVTTESKTCSVTDCLKYGFTFGVKYCPSTCKVCPSTCALHCLNDGYLNYVTDQTGTRCACYCPTGFTGTECKTSTATTMTTPTTTPTTTTPTTTTPTTTTPTTTTPTTTTPTTTTPTTTTPTTTTPTTTTPTTTTPTTTTPTTTTPTTTTPTTTTPTTTTPTTTTPTTTTPTTTPTTTTPTTTPTTTTPTTTTPTTTTPTTTTPTTTTTDQCHLSCGHRGVLDYNECKCTCRRNFYGVSCEKNCFREARCAARRRIRYLCQRCTLYTAWCARSCRACRGWWCRNRYRRFCRMFVRRNMIQAIVGFCKYRNGGDCQRICRRFT